MKSKIMKDFVNFGRIVEVRDETGQDPTEFGYASKDLSQEFSKWRSKARNALTIKVEADEPTEVNCIYLGNTNISPRGSVICSGYNSDGFGESDSPIFSISLQLGRRSWIYLSEDNLPACKYFRISIVDDDPVPEFSNSIAFDEYIEISKILIGEAKDFPLEVLDGYTYQSESFQKREITNGQVRAGNVDAQLDTLDYDFKPVSGLNNPGNEEQNDALNDFEILVEELQESQAFLWIFDRNKPEREFGYMVINEGSLDFSVDENEMISTSLSFKEQK